MNLSKRILIFMDQYYYNNNNNHSLLTAAQFFPGYAILLRTLIFYCLFFILVFSLLDCTANISFLKYVT